MPRRPTFTAVYNALTYVEDAIGDLPHNLEEEQIEAIINELEDLESWLRDISIIKTQVCKKRRRVEEHAYTTPPQGTDQESEEEEEGQVVDKYLKWCGHLKTEICEHDETQLVD